MKKRLVSILIAGMLTLSLTACGQSQKTTNAVVETTAEAASISAEQEYIEETLNLANNKDQEWTYDSQADAWILSIVSAVAYPEIEDQQGVSVCVPGTYVKGLDTNNDGESDKSASDCTQATKGSLVIDYDASIVSSNGQTYTASSAPVIINTGAAGYGSSTNTLAATTYASEGYINISCGNRGKQDVITDDDGNEIFTGDAPSCLVDQKNAARFVKYNILLGNLPGNVDYFVSTGGSGGGAHATMFATTSNNPDYYDYEIACGAVGVYQLEDGTYSTSVTIDGTTYDISDGAWGCIAYSAITSLYEADMAMAFEYFLDVDYDFNSEFQKKLAEYLSEEYMTYINDQNLSVLESTVGFDLNNDNDKDDTIQLSIEYDPEKYASTNGYGGTYLDLYLAEFISNLQWYLDNLDYAEGWTWFDENGTALSDDEVAAMTIADKSLAFIEGRYAKSESQGMMSGPGGQGGQMPNMMGNAPDGQMPDKMGAGPDGQMPDKMGDGPDGQRDFANSDVAANSAGDTMDVGTPDEGTTQSAGSNIDSANYSTYEEMLEAYQTDIAEIEAGDQYGNNIVDMINPLKYISDEETESPTWVRIVMGASEGDMSMFSSLNLQIAMLNAGIDATIEWQWDGGHVPSEIFGDSLALYVDEMYDKYIDTASTIEKQSATPVTSNGDATEATGKDISSWVNYSNDSTVSFSLEDAVSYRTAGASKATPGFDVIDYGQEDYVFGDSDQDARHWSTFILKVLEEHADVLAKLFNKN